MNNKKRRYFPFFLVTAAIITSITGLGSATYNYIPRFDNYSNIIDSNFLDNGTFVMIGNATVFDDVVSPLDSAVKGINSPPFNETTKAYYFEDKTPAALEEYVFVTVQIPHSYKEGSDIGCHMHIHPSNTNTGNATFELLYTWTNINAVEATPTSINVTKEMSGIIGNMTIFSFGEINGTGKTISSIFEARIKRTSSVTSDTFTGSVYVDSFDCHIERDTLGSNTEYSKW